MGEDVVASGGNGGDDGGDVDGSSLGATAIDVAGGVFEDARLASNSGSGSYGVKSYEG